MIFDISLIKAESVIDIGASEMKRIDEERWWNYQFTAALAGIAIVVMYFLVKSSWLAPKQPAIKKGSNEKKTQAVKIAGVRTKHETKDEIEEDFEKVSEVNYRPVEEVEEDESEKTLKIVFKGAKWGFYAGFVAAMIYIQMRTPTSLGFYPGDIGLVFLAFLGPGTAIGALYAWLGTLISGQKS